MKSTTTSAEPLLPTYEDAECMAVQFLLTTAGLVDLFPLDTFFLDLKAWVDGRARNEYVERSSLFYLVLAIGAQAFLPECQQYQAEHYFSRGRQQALNTFTEAPSLMTVQAYVLITVYLLGACRRNSAYMQFGIACRATHALGIHLDRTHSLFDARESQERRSTWRSVRMLDVFFSASLGRPPATCNLSVPGRGEVPEAINADEFSRKILSLTSIYDRIVIEVYERKAISTHLAENISQQLRAWTEHMPDCLNLQMLPSYDKEKLTGVLAATHVISAYHGAIILLTRPFLTSQIVQDMNRKRKAGESPTEIRGCPAEIAVIKKFADACVDSSLKGLDIVESLLEYPNLPKRLPFIINAVCNMALVLGAAIFADQDKNFPLEEGLKRSLNILRHFTPHDPHASRYEQIITYLSDAVEEYIIQRKRQAEELREQEVSLLFGSVSQPKGKVVVHPLLPTLAHTPLEIDISAPDLLSTGTVQMSDRSTPASHALSHNASLGTFQFSNIEAPVPNAMQPPSSIFGDANLAFPDDAYLFMQQEPSIFGFYADS